MSAGRLQLFDKRASLRDKASRLLIRLPGDRELRLREFGTQQPAWAKLLPPTLGTRRRSPARPRGLARSARGLAALLRRGASAARVLRDQRVIAGIGRSWVDEILWTAMLSPFKRGDDLDDDERERCATRSTPGRGVAPLRGEVVTLPDKLPLPLKVHRHRRAMPPVRRHDRGGPLRGLRHVLLPERADGRTCAQGPPALAPAEVVDVLVAALITAVIAQAAAPVAVTGSAGSVTSGGAVVAGTVDPQGSPTTYQVEYGTSSSTACRPPRRTPGPGTTRSRSACRSRA